MSVHYQTNGTSEVLGTCWLIRYIFGGYQRDGLGRLPQFPRIEGCVLCLGSMVPFN